MENIQKITERIILGLFFSSLYLGSSFLTSYLSAYWNLWNPAYTWIAIGLVTYTCIREVETKASTIGIILIAGLWLYHPITATIPSLWIYILVNSIVCLNIIIAYITKDD